MVSYMKVVNDDILKKAIMMSLANIKLEEDCINNYDMNKTTEKIEEKIKKKVLK